MNLPSTGVEDSSADAELIALGQQLEVITAALDRAIASGDDVDELLHTLGPIETAIVAKAAGTIEGLAVKARAAAWARLGDLDPTAEATTDRRMALSIVRDIIQLCDPEREHPHALRDLVAETRQGD